MEELRVENWTADELRRHVERSAKHAIRDEMQEVRETANRFAKQAYLQKEIFTLEEAAKFADVSLGTLRDWRRNGLPESTVGDRVYIQRADLVEFICSSDDE